MNAQRLTPKPFQLRARRRPPPPARGLAAPFGGLPEPGRRLIRLVLKQAQRADIVPRLAASPRIVLRDQRLRAHRPQIQPNRRKAETAIREPLRIGLNSGPAFSPSRALAKYRWITELGSSGCISRTRAKSAAALAKSRL